MKALGLAAILLIQNSPQTGMQAVQGRVIVEGGGPAPRFSLTQQSGVGASSPILINPQMDGTFTTSLPGPLGQITGATGLPAGLTLKSASYGSTDVMKNPPGALPAGAELRITLGITGASPWVSLSGRVAGLQRTQGARVVLAGPIFGAPQETSVNADGSFTFSKILPGNYTARVSLSGDQRVVPIAVGPAGVSNVTISASRQFLVTGHVMVEDGSLPPAVILEARNPAGTVVSSFPEPAFRGTNTEGVFILRLGDGEYRLSLRSAPPGYQLRSITYGSADLLKEPLKLDGPQVWEIIVRLTARSQ